MTRTIRSSAVTLLALLAGIAPGIADEPVAKLPKEGVWARYHAITKKDDGEEKVGTMTLKSLNSVTVDGVACRWFESEYVGDEGMYHERRKFLLPEAKPTIIEESAPPVIP